MMFKIPLDTSPLILSLSEFAQLINDGKSPQEITITARWTQEQTDAYIREIFKASLRKNPSKSIADAANRLKSVT